MIICNTTFMIEREREKECAQWLKDYNIPLDSGRSPRLSAMRMAGGVDYRHAEAQSLAYQLEFDSMEQATAWTETVLPEVASAFERKFAPQAMIFSSIFESLPL